MSRRILLADDSVTIQKVIELTFMDEDFAVTAVSNGDEALARLAEVQPDLVIADVHMPGANGYEVCRRAKAWRAGVPVLLLVGTFEPFDEGEMRAAGADAHLKKPFDSQELLSLVHELLARAPGAPAAAAAAPEAAAAPVSFEAVEAAWGSFALSAEPEPAAPALQPAAEPASAPAPAAAPAESLSGGARSAGFDWAETSRFDEPTFELEDTGEALGLDDSLLHDHAAAPAPTTLEERVGVPLGSAPLTAGLPEIEEHLHGAEERHEQPFLAPVAPSEPPAPAFAAAAPPLPVGAVSVPGRLSDDDVDRIARRVVELLGDKAVRDVAWEVVPDMAEVVIKDRLRELESQVE
jgi:CheY-like chemotaxis protein